MWMMKAFHNTRSAQIAPDKCDRCYWYDEQIGVELLEGGPHLLLLCLENLDFNAESAVAGAFQIPLRAEALIELPLQMALDQLGDIEHLLEYRTACFGGVGKVEFGFGGESSGFKDLAAIA